jgi:ankyrin repeat protein
LATAQLAVAREYGFASWPKLKREVERREVLDTGDVTRLRALLDEDAGLATEPLEHWCDHPQGASPLGYVAMLRYDTARGVWRDVPGTGLLAEALLRAGAPVDGEPGDRETPLITAASYGDVNVARVLIGAGADVEARASEDAGGVPGGTPLLHAAVFAMTNVIDVLAAAGAVVHGVEEAAATGNIDVWLDDAPADARVRALVMAAAHGRLRVIDQLVEAGVPVDAVDEAFGGQPLREAAANGRASSTRRLLELGADPNLRDDDGRSALDWCRRGRDGHANGADFDEIERMLEPLTADAPTKPSSRANPKRAEADLKRDGGLRIEIRAEDFPGSACGPGPEGEMYEDIHVGLARRTETVELVRGNASRAAWSFDVTVRRDDSGALDLGGPFVHGTRGARHLGLRWVVVTPEDELRVFRGAKLRISDVEPELLEEAVRGRRALVATVGMTDEHGHPICATIRPPLVEWSVGSVRAEQ